MHECKVVFLIHMALSNVKSLAVVISLITTLKKNGIYFYNQWFPLRYHYICVHCRKIQHFYAQTLKLGREAIFLVTFSGLFCRELQIKS
jgi:hypothetical protein